MIKYIKTAAMAVLGAAAGLLIVAAFENRMHNQDIEIQRIESQLSSGKLYRQYYFFVEVPYIIQGPPIQLKPTARLDKHR